jgi:signal transduction histidine kinase
MNADDLYRRYQKLQQYVGWTEEDAQRVQSLAALLEPRLTPLIDDFYAEIERHPEARKVITGGAAQIDRLKVTLRTWLHELLAGPYDRAYVVRRWRVGWRHVEIGLDQVYTNVALSRLRRGLLQALDECGEGNAHHALAVRRSLNTLLDLDLAIIEDAYQAEYLARQQRSERLEIARLNEQAVQNERLAGIGQMMTGLAHESGNALARSQSCLEMLTWEVEDRPAALDLIARIQKAQDHLKQLYEEVRGYAAPLKLERDSWELSAIWRQAWGNLALQRQSRDATLQEDIGGLDLRCAVDQFRLEQVFRNVLENALAACKDPVRICVRCAATEIGGRPALLVAVRDNGPGLNAEQRQRIFEPFFTTKTKGTGLGMAIAKRIVDAHGGQISVGSEPQGSEKSDPPAPDDQPNGAEIRIVLPREKP